MNRLHCDICDAVVEDRARGSLWANQLPTDDPLRNITGKITFASSKKQEIDLCATCLNRWLSGLWIEPSK